MTDELYRKLSENQRSIKTLTESELKADKSSLLTLASIYAERLKLITRYASKDRVAKLSDDLVLSAEELTRILKNTLALLTPETRLTGAEYFAIALFASPLVSALSALFEANTHPKLQKLLKSSKSLLKDLNQYQIMDSPNDRYESIGRSKDILLTGEKQLATLERDLKVAKQDEAEPLQITEDDRATNRAREEHSTAVSIGDPTSDHRWKYFDADFEKLVDDIAVRLIKLSRLVSDTALKEGFRAMLLQKLDSAINSLQGSEYAKAHGLAPENDEVELARRRGLEMQATILDSEDMLDETSVMERLSVRLEELSKARGAGHVLALPHPTRSNEFRYPSWQFDGELRKILPEVLAALYPLTAWAKWHFFMTPNPVLFELTPLEALKYSPTKQSQIYRSRVSSILIENKSLINAVKRAAEYYAGGSN